MCVPSLRSFTKKYLTIIIYNIQYLSLHKSSCWLTSDMVTRSDKKILPETKSTRVYDDLKLDICHGRLRPGDRLIISKTAEMYDTSEIPVREAFSRLKAEGFLTIIPHKGIYVTEIDVEYLEKLYPMRSVLEGYATRLATPFLTGRDLDKLSEIIEKMHEALERENYTRMGQLNYEFHMAIYRACGNDPLIDMIDDLWWKTNRIRAISELERTIAARSNQEHRGILEALRNKKKRKAERLITEQKEKSLKSLVKYMKKEG